MGKAYGDTMGGYFRAREEPLSVQSAALENDVAITHLRCNGPGTGITNPIPPEAAILLAIQLRPLVKHDLWLDGRGVAVSKYDTGAVTMLDLRAKPVANLDSPYECLQFYLPQAALNTLSDIEDLPRLDNLPVLNGAEDKILAHMAQISKAIVNLPGPASGLMLDSILLALHRHLQTHYAGIQVRQNGGIGYLAPWQERTVKEFMEANLGRNIHLSELAALCKVSVSWFGRAFKTTIGMTPHQWLMKRRIARARHLLMTTDKKIVDIAQLAGFADQSHLGREFIRAEGVSPAAWRSAHRNL